VRLIFRSLLSQKSTLAITLLTAASIFPLLLAFSANGTIPAGAKIFIAPMEGELDGFIAAEVIKKKLPVAIVVDEKEAEYVLSGASLKADDKWYNVVFGGKDKNEGNVRLLDVKNRQMIWAGEAGDRSLWYGGFKRGGERKVAERIVEQMKKSLFK
jgi:hypothetical protein